MRSNYDEAPEGNRLTRVYRRNFGFGVSNGVILMLDALAYGRPFTCDNPS